MLIAPHHVDAVCPLQQQIHLLGNPVIWYSAFLSVIVYLGVFVLYLMRRQRGVFDLSEGKTYLGFVIMVLTLNEKMSIQCHAPIN